MKTITPFLWFNNQAEEAARFYTSVFKNSKILSISRYSKAGPGPEGSVMTVEPERRYGAHDEAWMRRLQLAVEPDPPRQVPGFSRIENNIGAICQSFKHSPRGRAFHLKAEALLPQVIALEAQTVFRVGLRRGEGAEAARVIAGGRLDLRDERAGIAEQFRCVRAGDPLRDIDDAHVREGAIRH